MTRTRLELTAAVALTALAILTLVWPDWIEGVFGLDPDAGSGFAEASVVVVCALGAGALWLRGLRRRTGPAETRVARQPESLS